MKTDTNTITATAIKKNKSFISMQYVPPLLITLILIAGHITFGILQGYKNILLSIGCSMLTELVLARSMFGTWRNLSSAYITGISVGILVRSPYLWPFALTAVVSIMSKYVLRYRNTHIWNPSNFGVTWMFALLPVGVAGLSIQWGNNIWPMLVIWILGLIIVWRVKRLHITLTYVISFILFSFLRSLITGDSFLTEVSPITGPMYQLFVFFMITDPATTVKNKKGQILVAFLIALVEFVFRLNQMIYSPFYALFIVGPVAMVISLYLRTVPVESRPEKKKG
jgi:Na+-transporting NADH:ubiquinone oxidoreductase subunit NqrB